MASFEESISVLETTKTGPEMKQSISDLINLHINRLSNIASRLWKLSHKEDQNG